MKWILILMSVFLLSCSSSESEDEDSISPVDEVPENLIGFWQQACDTEGYDEGSILTTHKSSILFKEYSAVFIYEVFGEDECEGDITARSIDEFPFRIEGTAITEDGLEATIINADNNETGVQWEYSYHQSGSLLYIGSTSDLENLFNFEAPYFR